ncbi:transcriptional repressor [Myxococcota bacterium]|nr:transcriptional repressor [Myxococcota bacterium]
MTSPTDEFDSFAQYIREQGLKLTRQREDILRVFIASHRHINLEQLHREVRKVNPTVGYATVYRTMKLLTEAGLAQERRFGDGHTLYEPREPQEHHDHMICTRCGRIEEFENESIERLQHKVAEQHGFRMTHHRMELYGICSGCLAGRERVEG